MIRACIIDDELPALQELEYLLGEYREIEVAGLFEDPLEALKSIELKKPDVVFLDIDMPHMNGIELALKIQSMRLGIIIIFVTAYSEYSLEAFRAYPLDYILKPIDDQRFKQTMTHVIEQHELRQSNLRNKNTVSIRCFGRLEVTKTGENKESLKLSNKKLKELLAYLIHHCGKPVTRKELLQLLFEGVEDKKTINYLHVTVYNIRNMLESFGIDRSLVLIKENYSLEIASGVCDYVDFVNFIANNLTIEASNILEAERLIGLYKGPYLEEDDYIWGLETREWLENQFEKLLFKVAAFYDSAGKMRKAEAALLRLLELNPLSEDGNQALLEMYLGYKKIEKYIRHYENYAKELKQELNISPADKYVRYYMTFTERM